MSRKLSEELQKLSTEDYKSLVKFAESKLSILFHSQKVPGGDEAEDFVQEAITKVIEGKRKWDPQKNPNFIKFLLGVISSIINNHTRKLISKSHSDIEAKTEIDFWNNILSVDRIVERLELKELEEYIYNQLEEDDEELALLLMYQLDGYEPQDLHEMLEYDRIEDVYNANKRLKRRCRNYIEEFQKEDVGE